VRDVLLKLCRGEDLTGPETARTFQAIMRGEADPAQVGGFLVGIAAKGANAEELAAAAEVIRAHCLKIDVGDERVLDTCGTGGDYSGTFNISTAAALVTAASGVKVVKHGSRSATSKSGSADVLEEMGVNLMLDEKGLKRCLDEAGICFAFAWNHHPAMKHVAPVRQTLGVATIFNLLGPLANPAAAKRQLLGVYRAELTELLANVLQRLGSERAWVVHAEDGLDELSTMGPTRISELADGHVTTWSLRPEQYGFAPPSIDSLRVGSAKASAKVIREVLEGREGPARDIVLLNAAGALVVADAADDIASGLEIAAHAVDSGRAGETLDALARLSQSV
jgi:anthranilate phosphoribosyltransferase